MTARNTLSWVPRPLQSLTLASVALASVALVSLALVSLAGCAETINEHCDGLADCGDADRVEPCKTYASNLQQAGRTADCELEVENYLDCVVAADSCDDAAFNDGCAVELAAVEQCGVDTSD